MPRRRHDPFLKRLYRCGLPDAVRLFFPDLAAGVDWSRFAWNDKEIVLPSPRPRSLVADLVGEAPDTAGTPLRLFVHPELQSQLHADMGWRVLQYDAGFVLQLADPNVRVLTFVFYHCKGAGRIEERTFGLEFQDRWVMGVRYWTVGIGDLEAERYAEEENPMAWGLAAWMRPPPSGRVELKLRLVEKILGRMDEGAYQDVLFDAVESYYPLDRADRDEERRVVAAAERGGMGNVATTFLERLERKARRAGREEGRQEGRQEGREEGREEGFRHAVLGVLRSRFGDLPDDMVSAVERVTDRDRLGALVERAATAASIDEILRELGE